MTAASPKPVIAASADGSRIFTLIPLEEGRWELQAISGWQTAAPTIQSLQLEGEEPRDDQNFILPQLTVSPDGRFLLVRMILLRFGTYQRSAVITLVDLQAFQIVWRRVETDLLLAYSRWKFADDGRLIAAQGPAVWDYKTDEHHVGRELVPYDVLQVNPASPGEHRAAVLSLPNLTVELPCQYRVPGEANSDKPSPEAAYEDDPPARDRPLVETEGAGCPALLKAARVSSAAELSGSGDVGWGKLGISPCEAFALSTGRSIGMMDCRDHHAIGEDGRPIQAPIPDINFEQPRGPAFHVHVGRYQDSSATLAHVDGERYLVLLRKGLKLELYKLP